MRKGLRCPGPVAAPGWDAQLVSGVTSRLGKVVLIAGEVRHHLHGLALKMKWGKIGPRLSDAMPSFLIREIPIFAKTAQKLSSQFLNSWKTAFYLYLRRGRTAPLPGRCKSS